MKTNKYMLGKASFSSLSGWPIAFAANIMVLPLFVTMLQDQLILASVAIGVIFGLISILRLFLIDWVENKYGLNIRPDHLIKKVFKR